MNDRGSSTAGLALQTSYRGDRAAGPQWIEEKAMIDVHYLPSANGKKVSIMLEEVGLPYRILPYDLLAGDHLTADYLAINPNGRLPAIVDHEPTGGGGPLAVFESGAILMYLSDKAGGALMPSGPRGRSTALQWLIWQVAGFGPMLGQAVHFRKFAPEGQDYSTARYLREARRLFAVLESRLVAVEYLADEYSIADIAVWPWVSAIRPTLHIDLAEYPAIGRWFADIAKRPAVARGTAHQLADSKLLASRPDLNRQEWSNLFGDTYPGAQHDTAAAGRS